MEHGANGVAKHVADLAQVPMPDFFAGKVIGINPSRTVADVDQFAVRSRCTGAIRVVLLGLLRFGIDGPHLPKLFPVGPVEA